ncbi:phosphatidylserine decarboxylase [Elusimicrobium simillimum]|uniref:archaetidylserine decarboxylase n=1 Tax=Elusimicrobium simillimum TaxID=3143438 RepID=UPI003C6F5B85
MSSLTDNIKIAIQYLIPKKFISIVIGAFAKADLGALTTFVIKIFIKHYNVDMTEVIVQDVKQFKCFNDFFVRKLQDGARPIAQEPHAIIHTADGTLSEFGNIDKDLLLQAKNRYYSLNTLLGGNEQDSKPFENGIFATTYLAPSNYHRVHMPCDGKLEKVIYIPGCLFSVNPLVAKKVDSLFARNERAVCFFSNDKLGKFTVVLVGAAVVSGISLVVTGETLSAKSGERKTFDYTAENIFLKKGAELGMFFLGSTVICIFPKNKVVLGDSLKQNVPVTMGTELGKIL